MHKKILFILICFFYFGCSSMLDDPRVNPDIPRLTLHVENQYIMPATTPTVPVEFVFSEDVTDFEESDLDVVGGVVDSLEGSGKSFIAWITVTNGKTAVVTLRKNGVYDAATKLRGNSVSSCSVEYSPMDDVVAFATPSDFSSYIFEFAALPESTYTYTLISSEAYKVGGGPFVGSGTVGDSIGDQGSGSSRETVGPLNLSERFNPGGYLIITLTIVDPDGTTNRYVKAIEDNNLSPCTDVANFSGSGSYTDISAGVIFDISDHSYQALPSESTPRVKYDTDTFIGSPYSDRIRFTALESGENFSIQGGGGDDVIDLSNYTGDQIHIQYGNRTGSEYSHSFGNTNCTTTSAPHKNSGYIVVDVDNDGFGGELYMFHPNYIRPGVGGEDYAGAPYDSDDVRIDFTDIHLFEFNGKIFDGTPHGVELASEYDHEFIINGKTMESRSRDCKKRVPAIINFNGVFSSEFTIETTVTVYQDGDGSWKRAGAVFDYEDAENFKFAEFAGSNTPKWTFCKIFGGSLNNSLQDVAFGTFELGVPYTITLVIRDSIAEIWSDGEFKKWYDYGDPLNNGRVGVIGRASQSFFVLNFSPTNWAPYAQSYYIKVSQSESSSYNLDILADAVDHEGSQLAITAITSCETGANEKGSLINNGDGTVTYSIPTSILDIGTDIYDYTVSDGENETTKRIYFQTIP